MSCHRELTTDQTNGKRMSVVKSQRKNANVKGSTTPTAPRPKMRLDEKKRGMKIRTANAVVRSPLWGTEEEFSDREDRPKRKTITTYMTVANP